MPSKGQAARPRVQLWVQQRTCRDCLVFSDPGGRDVCSPRRKETFPIVNWFT
jgi:hypothetical protein